MIDLDHFKYINDDHGHAVGDKVLQEMARICELELRGSDVLGRVGGEEFLLLLPDTPMANAIYAAERMREHLSQQVLSMDGHTLRLTASFGVAAIDHSMSRFADLLDRADSALYQAKHGGRDQVRTAELMTALSK
jgi:diguanylate cyclase (GGDEF)-like protein